MKAKSLAIGLSLLLSGTNIYSQVSAWTWINGDSTVNSLPVWGTQGVPSTINNPGARMGGAGWADRSGNIWIFGGSRSTGGNGNDLWRYKIATHEWTWMKGSNTSNPLGNYGVQGTSSSSATPGNRYWISEWADTAGNFWLYGGRGTGYNPGGDLNDLWKYNPLVNEWSWIKGDSTTYNSPNYGTLGTPLPTNNPGSRDRCFTWTDNSNHLWLYGGQYYASGGGQIGLSDLWKYDIANGMWTWVNGSALQQTTARFNIRGVASPQNNPGGRYGSTTWKDAAGNLWLFGGAYLYYTPAMSEAWRNDLWKYDISTNLWTWMHGDTVINKNGLYGTRGTGNLNTAPASRVAGASWIDSTGNFWLFGGGFRNDLWKYNVNTNIWTWVNGDSTRESKGRYGIQNQASLTNAPSARDRHMYIKEESTGNFWIFGGGEYDHFGALQGVKNDIWMFSTNASIVVPLHLLSFTAKLKQQQVNLHWASENEINFERYEVERSTDSRTFATIGSLKAKMGSGQKNEYMHDDNVSSIASQVSRLYYRLKMVDKDGRYSYSEICSINLRNTSTFTVAPNPAANSINVFTNTNIKSLQFLSSIGEVLLTVKNISNGLNVDITTLLKGAYIIKAIYETGDVKYTQMIKL